MGKNSAVFKVTVTKLEDPKNEFPAATEEQIIRIINYVARKIIRDNKKKVRK